MTQWYEGVRYLVHYPYLIFYRVNDERKQSKFFVTGMESAVRVNCDWGDEPNSLTVFSLKAFPCFLLSQLDVPVG